MQKSEDTTKSDNINLFGELFSILNTQKRKPSGSMPADAPPSMASARSAKTRNYLRKHVFKTHLRRKSTNYLRKHT